MDVEFDPDKDAINIAKHGLSLARVVDLEFHAVELDDCFTIEERYLAYGMMDGFPHSVAFTMRGSIYRILSFRRAHIKEYRRHVRT